MEGRFVNKFMKPLILVVVILYVISPVDIAPGPLDDLIVVALGLASTKMLKSN